MGQADSRQGLAGCLLLALPPAPARLPACRDLSDFPRKTLMCLARRVSPEETAGKGGLLPAASPRRHPRSHQARQALPHMPRDGGTTWSPSLLQVTYSNTPECLTPACTLPAPACTAGEHLVLSFPGNMSPHGQTGVRTSHGCLLSWLWPGGPTSLSCLHTDKQGNA